MVPGNGPWQWSLRMVLGNGPWSLAPGLSKFSYLSWVLKNSGLTGGTSGSAATTECVILVLLEMGLSFFGIVSNLLIVSTLRNPKQEERLNGSTINYLLFNLCFSNLVISFLVKPISAIYVGYAVTTGEAQVSRITGLI